MQNIWDKFIGSSVRFSVKILVLIIGVICKWLKKKITSFEKSVKKKIYCLLYLSY